MAYFKGVLLIVYWFTLIPENLGATQIIPHQKGNDFCGSDFVNGYHYIIRSDLGIYLRSSDLTSGSNDATILPLSDACKGGDHYLTVTNGGRPNPVTYYYIIKGNQYRRNRGLDTDRDAKVWNLHPNCRGGKHYFGGRDHYKYIIFPDNTYRRVTDMTSDSDAVQWKLHPNCQGGLYYWACEDYKYFVKQGLWGIEYHRVKDLELDTNHEIHSFRKQVISFLPGGLAVNYGPVFGEWRLVKSFRNPSNSMVEFTKKITTKVGYNKQVLSSTEHNWNIAASVSYSAGTLTEAIAKVQMSLSVAYGGKQIDTKKQDWSKSTETSEQIKFTLKAGETVYLWQYQIGFGKNTGQPALFGKNLVTSSSNVPPKDPAYNAKSYTISK